MPGFFIAGKKKRACCPQKFTLALVIQYKGISFSQAVSMRVKTTRLVDAKHYLSLSLIGIIAGCYYIYRHGLS